MINRREAIRRVAIIMGGALSTSAIAGVLQGCTAKGDIHWKPIFFSEKQAAIVTVVAERILPKTNTPGAIDAGVPEFIDSMLLDIYRDEEQLRFVAGLDRLENDSQVVYGHAFTELKPQQQDELLKKYAKEAEEKRSVSDKEKTFFFDIKQLTMLGFFTSEIGARQFLHFERVPGRYDGCVPLEKIIGTQTA